MRLMLIFLSVLVIWAASFWGIFIYLPNWQARGQFGDLFGSVNALFSGLAFAGLICTILLQRNELKLQREELKLQREEMTASRQELARQAEVQLLQYRASVALLRVQAAQARIAAFKMDAEQRTPGARTKWVEYINNEAEKIEVIANSLEGNQ